MDSLRQLILAIKQENIIALQNWSTAHDSLISRYSRCFDNVYGSYLHYAAGKGLVRVMEFFLDGGMDIDSRNCFAETPLSISIYCEQSEALLTLLDHGAVIRYCNYKSILCHEPSHFDIYKISSTAASEDTESHRIDKILVKYVAKWQFKGTGVYKDYFEGSDVPEQLTGFFQKCKEELKLMKSESIGEISMFDFFTAKADELARHRKSMNIVQALKLTDYRVKFPMYEELITRHLTRIVGIRNIFDQCECYLTVLFPQFPIICIDVVLGMLNNADAKNVISAFQRDM